MEEKKDSFAKLIHCLEDEINIYQHLHSLVLREKELLVQTHVVDLIESNKAKDNMIVHLKSIERVREEIVKELAVSLLILDTRPKFSQLIAKLPPSQASQLGQRRDVLALLVERVTQQNKANEALIHSVLKVVRGSLDSIRGVKKENKMYRREGDMQVVGVNSGQLVSREV